MRYRNRSRKKGMMTVGIVTAIFFVVIMIPISSVREKNRCFEEKQKELTLELEEEQNRKKALEQYEAYTKTNDFYVSVARSRFGLVFENETIFKEKKD